MCVDVFGQKNVTSLQFCAKIYKSYAKKAKRTVKMC